MVWIERLAQAERERLGKVRGVLRSARAVVYETGFNVSTLFGNIFDVKPRRKKARECAGGDLVKLRRVENRVVRRVLHNLSITLVGIAASV